MHTEDINDQTRNMKTIHLLAALIAATLPLTAVLAEDTAKTETTDKQQEQSSETGMKGMEMGQMMSNSKDQDAELDKLVAEMNSASADKKLDAIAAVLTKLVEQRKAMHEQMQKMVSANDKERTGMCRMMGCDNDGKHSHHH
jgi:formate dehydrogenase maturation protein FdhE